MQKITINYVGIETGSILDPITGSKSTGLLKTVKVGDIRIELENKYVMSGDQYIYSNCHIQNQKIFLQAEQECEEEDDLPRCTVNEADPLEWYVGIDKKYSKFKNDLVIFNHRAKVGHCLDCGVNVAGKYRKTDFADYCFCGNCFQIRKFSVKNDTESCHLQICPVAGCSKEYRGSSAYSRKIEHLIKNHPQEYAKYILQKVNLQQSRVSSISTNAQSLFTSRVIQNPQNPLNSGQQKQPFEQRITKYEQIIKNIQQTDTQQNSYELCQKELDIQLQNVSSDSYDTKHYVQQQLTNIFMKQWEKTNQVLVNDLQQAQQKIVALSNENRQLLQEQQCVYEKAQEEILKVISKKDAPLQVSSKQMSEESEQQQQQSDMGLNKLFNEN